MAVGKRTSPEIESRILELRAQGKFYREIQEELGVSSRVVRRLLSPESYKKWSSYRSLRRKKENSTKVHTTINGVRARYLVEGRRLKPEKCEKCGKKRKRMGWHHWDDNDLRKGMWLCWPCHIFAERVDYGEAKKYLELKEKYGNYIKP